MRAARDRSHTVQCNSVAHSNALQKLAAEGGCLVQNAFAPHVVGKKANTGKWQVKFGQVASEGGYFMYNDLS
jgi:hypothetical protein